MTLFNRFQQVLQGCLVVTGNTFQIRQGVDYPGSSVDFRNGSYISTNTGITAASGFPAGTSFSASNASSTAVLNILPNSTVVYAQLVWILTNSSAPDSAVTFITPSGSNTINPDTTKNQSISSFSWRTKDVTSIVSSAGSGTYQLKDITGPTITNGVSIEQCSWHLIVVYKNSSLPFRFISINIGLSAVSAGSPSNLSFSIVTLTSGLVKGYLVTTQTGGDLLDGAQIWIGPTEALSTKVGNSSTGSWNTLAPYAQINNMLPGNILIADCNDPNIGLLDTRGTFGSYNKNPFAGTAPAYARNNTDILGIDISNKLNNSQISLFTKVTYGGSGSGLVTGQSVQIDTNSANLNPIKTVDKAYADLGDVLTYTIAFKNTGLASANSVVLIDTIPNGTTFQTGSVYINGSNNPSAFPTIPSGISLGTMLPNDSTTVSFKVKVSSTIPSINPLVNKTQLTYNFVPLPGQPTQYVDSTSNSVTTQINNATISSSKQVDKKYATLGDVLTYTIPLSITGSVSAINVVLIDTIPNNTSLVSGSLKVNGISTSGSTNPPGLSLGTLSNNSITTVSYQVTVHTVPSPNPINNSGTTTYSYIVDPTTPVIISSVSYTSIVNTQVNYVNLSNVSKSTDKYFITFGDTITYTIVIPNTGNTTAANVIVKDTIPNGTIFINNSVTVNSITVTSANIQSGVTIPYISPGSSATLTFSVQVLQ